jgi:hypothetical protein
MRRAAARPRAPGQGPRKIARRIVRLYPRAWRARYEDEMLALVEQSAPRWRDVGDLARGSAREWTVMSGRTRTAVAVALALAASGCAAGCGWCLRQLAMPPPTFAWMNSPLLGLALVATMYLVWIPLPIFAYWREFRYSVERRNGSPPPVRLGGAYRCGALIYMFVFTVSLRWAASVPGPSTWIDLNTAMFFYLWKDLLDDRAIVARTSAGGPWPMGERSWPIGRRP